VKGEAKEFVRTVMTDDISVPLVKEAWFVVFPRRLNRNRSNALGQNKRGHIIVCCKMTVEPLT
jgi:hypothetical protein